MRFVLKTSETSKKKIAQKKSIVCHNRFVISINKIATPIHECQYNSTMSVIIIETVLYCAGVEAKRNV